jgi:hypothetical protein
LEFTILIFATTLGSFLFGCIPLRPYLVYSYIETPIFSKGEKIMFKQNEGILDRILRVVLGIVLLPTGLILFGVLKGNVLSLVIAGFGLWVLITGLTGVCPLYIPFGISTLEKENELFAKCRSMIAGFRQGAAGSGDPSAEQICGFCSPSIGKPHHQQEETGQGEAQA